MTPAERVIAKKAELAGLEERTRLVDVGDVANFVVGAGSVGLMGHELIKHIPRIPEHEIELQVMKLLETAKKAAFETSGGGIACKALEKHGLEANSPLLTGLRTSLQAGENGDFGFKAMNQLRNHFRDTLKTTPYTNNIANQVEQHFVGGVKGAAIAAAVFIGFACVGAGREVYNNYKDTRTASLKQDLTYAEMVDMRRQMDATSEQQR
jgi:hypothetical protein